MTDELHSFYQWISLGKVVKKGSRADQYLMSPDNSARLALFREDQTDPWVEGIDGWTEIVSREESEALLESAKRDKQHKGKVIVEQDSPNDPVYVWCGANTEVIAMLKKAKYTYAAGKHKWIAPHKDGAKVVYGLEYRGLKVVDSTVIEL